MPEVLDTLVYSLKKSGFLNLVSTIVLWFGISVTMTVRYTFGYAH
jgi:hypothetical protein